jgi:asparagine synthase (glutamine-hydrolysing)
LERLYRQHGRALGRELSGHFLVLLWDERASRLLIVQDRFPGLQTLYFAQTDGSVFFSDRIRPLLVARPALANRLSQKALYQFLRYSYISAPETIFRDVRQLEGGHTLEVLNRRLSIEANDPWLFSQERIQDEELALALYEQRLERVLAEFQQGGPVTFLLSGGLDTSVNVALAARHSEGPLETYCTGAPRFSTDAAYARSTATLFGTRHHEYLFDGNEVEALPEITWVMENPYYEPGVLLSFFTLRNAVRLAPAVAGADIADQVFGSCVDLAHRRYRTSRTFAGQGWRLHYALRAACHNPLTRSSSFFARIYSRFGEARDVNAWSSGYGFSNAEIRRLVRRRFCVQPKFDDRAAPDHDLSALLDFGCIGPNRDYALNGLLIKTGRIAAHFGLTYFTPFTDRSVFDFILSLDHQLRNRRLPGDCEAFTRKYLHRRLAGKLIGPEILDRAKQGGGISPSIHFQDNRRTHRIRATVLGSEFLNSLFHRKEMARLFGETSANAARILLLLNLHLWQKIILEEPARPIPDSPLDSFLAAGA